MQPILGGTLYSANKAKAFMGVQGMVKRLKSNSSTAENQIILRGSYEHL